MIEKETVAEGLGVDEEWSLINVHRTQKWIAESETLSEAIEKAIKSVKQDEFGEISGSLSEYEKKLVLTGMHITQHTITNTLLSLGKYLGQQE